MNHCYPEWVPVGTLSEPAHRPMTPTEIGANPILPHAGGDSRIVDSVRNLCVGRLGIDQQYLGERLLHGPGVRVPHVAR